MPRRYVFPDPDDRSPNTPMVVMSQVKVTGLYNQDHPEDQDMKNVTEKVKEWITRTAQEYGWDSISFAKDNTCVLERKDFQKRS